MCVWVTKSPCCASETLWISFTLIKYMYLRKYVSCFFFFFNKFWNLIWSWRNLSLGFFSSKRGSENYFIKEPLRHKAVEYQKGKINGPRIKQYRKGNYWFFCCLRLILVTYYHLQHLRVLFCTQLCIVKPKEGTSLLKTFSNSILFLIKNFE